MRGRLHPEQKELEARGIFITFPKNEFYRKELEAGFGKNGRLFDYTAYDAYLLDNYYSPERLTMMAERLRNAHDLPADKEAAIRDHILLHMEEVMKALIRDDSVETLALLAGEGFITAENIDAAIIQCSEAAKTGLLAFLMDYKKENIGFRETDLSL